MLAATDNRSKKEARSDAKAGHKALSGIFKRGRGRPRKIATEVIGDIAHVGKKAGRRIKRGFNKEIVESGVGKEIAKTLIDVGADVLLPAATTAASMALGDVTGLSGAVVGKVAGDQIQQAAEKKGYGYGLKGKHLKAQKDKMKALFIEMGVSPSHSTTLTNKVFKEGETVLDQDEVKVRGGKLSLKQAKHRLTNEAKKIWREARPVLKFAGEKALEYGEPLVEAGLKSAAMYAGMDPESADVASKIFTLTAKEKAQRGLNKISKKQSKDPQSAVDEASARIQKRTKKIIDKTEKRSLKAIENSSLAPEAKELAKLNVMEKANTVKADIDDKVEKVEAKVQDAIDMGNKKMKRVIETAQDMTGGMGIYSRDDMSTLLNPDSVAKQPFYLQPNAPQGNIRGFSGMGLGAGLSAGAGCSCGGSLYGDTMLGGSFRNYGGSMRGASFRM